MTGNKSPPKSEMLLATILEEAATLEAEKSAMFSIMLTFGASRPTKAGEETAARREKQGVRKKEPCRLKGRQYDHQRPSLETVDP
jgi:hypothetical protein